MPTQGSKSGSVTNDWSETVTEYGVSATNKGNWADNEGDGNSSYSSSDSGGGFHHNAYYLHYEQYRPGQNVPRPTKPQTDYPTLPGTSQGPSWADIAYHHLTHNPDVVFGLFTSPVYLVLTNSQVQDALVDAAIWAYNNPSEAGHLFLDAVGLVPGLGEAADAINSIWYSIEGDTTNAALSLAAVAPFAGWAATGGKVMSKLPLPSMAEATGKISGFAETTLDKAKNALFGRLGVSATIENSARGRPAAISVGLGALSNKQKRLLDELGGYGSQVIVKKSAASMNDLAALTAATGDEFLMLTLGGRRLIIRGSEKGFHGVVTEEWAQQMAAQGWRLSGHTHPVLKGQMSRMALMSSDGDRSILKIFNQQRSVIHNSMGSFSIFTPFGDM